ncbi:MAG: tetratricopeptide repeat protein, partial [Phycisphaerae bacterium]
AARTIRLRALEQVNARDFLGAFRSLRDGFRRVEADRALHRIFAKTQFIVQRSSQPIPDRRKIDRIIALLSAYRPPFTAPPRGASLAQIAQLLRARAARAARLGMRRVVVADLAEAFALDPRDDQIRMDYATALSGVGRVPQAIDVLQPVLTRHPDDGAANYLRARLAAAQDDAAVVVTCLEKALRGGAITPAVLRKQPVFIGVLGDPRVVTLLQAHAASQPTS